MILSGKNVYNESYPDTKGLGNKKRYIIPITLIIAASVGLVWRGKYKKARQ
jgi:hypothetical protein